MKKRTPLPEHLKLLDIADFKGIRDLCEMVLPQILNDKPLTGSDLIIERTLPGSLSTQMDLN